MADYLCIDRVAALGACKWAADPLKIDPKTRLPVTDERQTANPKLLNHLGPFTHQANLAALKPAV
jgi:hypothetical protein